MRIWEITRKPRMVIRDLSLPLTVVRGEARRVGEEIIPVVKDYLRENVLGYITAIDLILPTSHHTSIRVSDALREHPLVTQDLDLGETFNLLRKFKVFGSPVVNDLSERKLIGVVSYNDMLNYLIKMNYKPIAETISEIMTTKNLDKYIVSCVIESIECGVE